MTDSHLPAWERGFIRVARKLLNAPDAVVRALTLRRWTIDGHPIDRRVQMVLTAGRFSSLSVNAADIQKGRESLRQITQLLDAPGPDVAVRDTAVEGAEGLIRARVYGAGEAPRPGIVFFHGGGFCQGDLDTHDGFCRRLSERAGCVVVAIDYRLAPENPFPAAVDDVLAAFRYVRTHAEGFGIDPLRLGVAGDSAGGCLSAVTSGLLINSGEPPPALQCLIYPSLDRRAAGRRRAALQSGFGLEAADIAAYFEMYGTVGLEDDERVSPGRRAQLAGLPPTIVTTAGFDLLAQEGDAYVAALRDAGVPVTHLHEPDMIHGYILMSALPGCERAIDAVTTAVSRRL